MKLEHGKKDLGKERRQEVKRRMSGSEMAKRAAKPDNLSSVHKLLRLETTALRMSTYALAENWVWFSALTWCPTSVTPVSDPFCWPPCVPGMRELHTQAKHTYKQVVL